MFIQESFSQPGDEAKARIAELEREVAALKHHQDNTQGRVSTKTFLLNVW
jgi:uncharacterized protein YceH (UPF0502 family)